MTTWFTADLHLGHTNIIKYCNRPFFTAREMDEALIENWNWIVEKDDLVFVLGDFSLLSSYETAQVINRLNGKEITFIRGSHDFWMDDIDNMVNWFERDDHTIYHFPGYYLELKDYMLRLPITLCHYAMRKWAVSHYGAFHLYGHSHGKLPGLGRSMDVGVDSWYFTPVSFETIHEKLINIEPHDAIKEKETT